MEGQLSEPSARRPADPVRHSQHGGKRVDYAIEIPKASSLILKHDLNAPLARAGHSAGQSHSSRRDRVLGVPHHGRPRFRDARTGPVEPGRAALASGSTTGPGCHRAAILMGPSGFVAVIAGWVTTEVGRQPYTVYGHLLTAQSHSPLGAPAVAASLIAFVLVYCAVFGAGIWYILHLMRTPPGPGETEPPHAPVRTAGITPAPALDAPGARRHDDHRPHHHLGVHHRLRRVHVCRDGRVRSRHRHSLPPLRSGRGARSGDELDRAGLGTATRPGWCWAAAGFWLPSRSLTALC